MIDEFEGLLLVHTDEGTKVAGEIKELELLIAEYPIPEHFVVKGGHLEMDLRSR